MTEEFIEWYEKEYPNCLWRKKSISKKIDIDFDTLSWDMRWGIYQLYFWDSKKWWLSIYPYTDKFGGKIRGFWDEGYSTRNFITNVPHQAQEMIVEVAFEMLKEETKK